ncbi:hypothetical protein PENDEC_c023G00430 [Penicillium decumbens]|uniref:25S rRNA (uridine-N(3))-methyltransferase BMT5-like domain-containing protein n=1 Tax=Penicillium decumbens TaxID=69771 RepID=A0A1V6P0M6_PENDC|nr:hypothetical protein PENDEC_c023G00430 [Penicillium decumbens]
MPRKKQKGPPRSKSAPPKPGPGPSQSKPKPKASGSKDGDFSFARSLAKQYKCRKLLATCYDSKETLFEKYPQAEGNIQAILPGDESKPYPKVLFSIDARKLGEKGGGGKEVKNGLPRRIAPWKVKAKDKDGDKPSGPWDVICFNFPHVGGISTDVNRQVRFNQELLVGFFKACVPLLSGVDGVEDDEDEDEDEDEWDEEEEEDVTVSGKAVRTGPGQILVSLFEGS